MSNCTNKVTLILLALMVNIVGFAANNKQRAGSLPYTTGTTYTSKTASVEFPFNGKSTDPATVTPADAFSLTTFSMGDDLKEAGSSSAHNKTWTLFQPISGASSASDAVRLEWSVKPSKGLTFTPTHVSANIQRFGTDGGLLDFKVINAEGKELTLATGIIPLRNNKDFTSDKFKDNEKLMDAVSFDIPDSFATSGNFRFVAYLYSLGNTKQVGFNDVKIEGTVNGTIENVQKYTFSAKTNPIDAGKITVYPDGDQFEAGTELTINTTRNFGYKFVNWTDSLGNEVSKTAKFKYTVNANTSFVANYEKINTYALNYSVEGGANSYQVQPDPKPTVVDGKNLYEEGTEVKLTASSNDIVTFTNWSTGETSSEISLNMTDDKNVVAHFSTADFVAAWDFYLPGSNGRKADFASEDNDADQLVLRDEEGNTSGWLDKCYQNGGYEGRPAGVNWRADKAIGSYYWQIKVNAQNFTDLKLKSSMAYNYNAYKTYKVEYSLDDSKWTTLGKIEMPGVKNWTDSTFDLPAETNNQTQLYIRWIADKTSSIDGTTSNNDGNAIGAIYLLGTQKPYNDGKAPKLVSTIPATGTANASANGRVVLTFDKKVKLADGAKATLGSEELDGSVSGKVITFLYNNLDYATSYTFTLPENTVSDLSGNTLDSAITVQFTTMNKPAITKQLYDFVIPDNGTFREAVAAASSREDKSKRFRIFVKKGTYIVPVNDKAKVTGSDNKQYSSVTTVLSANNVSLIGEDMDQTIIKNDVPYGTGVCPIEGIGKCDLLQITGSGTYLEDITLKNGTEDGTGRNLAVQEKGDKTVYKNVRLEGYQDTWTSNAGGRFYFEDGVIRGRTDYICGKGDVFFNRVKFLNVQTGGYIAVPSQPKKYGWILSNCTISAEDPNNSGNYTLGRPWGSGSPIALWINTTMESIPSAIGWSEMSGGWPKRFAEYNSMTSTGTAIDLSARKRTFGDNHENNPVLSADEAAKYTISTVMGGDDNWDPTALTEQASAPENVLLEKGTDMKLTWDDSNYALLWAVCKNDSVVAFTTTPSYIVDDANAKWSVRAANEMGGLGDATVANTATGIQTFGKNADNVVCKRYYNLSGMRIDKPQNGVSIVVCTMADGRTKSTKIRMK